ncbi:MAG: protein kinase domain-containing protein [Xenococcaceae cyanobacterium]
MNSIVGKILRGRYYIVKELGKGGFSVTYLAQDRDLPGYPLCVVKRLQPRINDRVSWQNAQKRFVTEAVVLQKLGENPQIPNLLAHFEENQEFYLVQEFVDGENLEEQIERQLFNETEAIAVLQDVLEILQFVHSRGVIHRDLKPSNLIRRYYDRKIVLIDFGAVKEITVASGMQATASYTNIIGTIGYMPPEQIAGQPNFTSDIYALGKTIVYGLTGQLIDEDSSTVEVANSANLGRLSPKLTNILNTMTKQNFNQRYQSVSDVLADLNKQEFSLPAIYPNTFNNNRNREIFTGNKKNDLPAIAQQFLRSKIVTFSAIAVILILLVSIGLSWLTVFKKNEEFQQFLTYENNLYNFKIKYPESWEKQEIDDPITGEIVAFVSENESDSDLFQEKIIITVEDLPIDTKTLEDYQEEIFEKLRKAKNSGLTIEEERPTKLSKRAAQKIVYLRQDSRIDLQQMEIFTIENERVFVITYAAERAKYSKFFKTAQAIIKSFEFK